MKYLTTSLILLFALSGCKKDEGIDPRDQYVGTYNVTLRSVVGYINLAVPTAYKTGNDILNVSKGDDPRYLTLTFSDMHFTTQIVNGGSFTVLPTSIIQKNTDGSDYYLNYDGDGTFSGNAINCNIGSLFTVSGYTSRGLIAVKGTKK